MLTPRLWQIGWGNGPAATIDDLFGTSWGLYEDVSTDTGITVSSLLLTTQFEGSISGDLKEWLLALVALGKFTESTYVNVGNAGVRRSRIMLSKAMQMNDRRNYSMATQS